MKKVLISCDVSIRCDDDDDGFLSHRVAADKDEPKIVLVMSRRHCFHFRCYCCCGVFSLKKHVNGV